MDPLGMIFTTLAFFGGVAGIIAANGWAKAERIRAEVMAGRRSDAGQDTVLAELKTMKQQMADMQNTSHQFDMSFDAALTRLEERVSRVEAKTAAAPASSPVEAPQRIGVR